MKVIAIDPSEGEVGWAKVDGLHQISNRTWNDSDSVWSWGRWKFKAKNPVLQCEELAGLLHPLDADDRLIVQWREGADDFRVGFIAGRCGLPWQQIVFVPPAKWDGVLSKELVRMRFFHENGIRDIYKVHPKETTAVLLLLEYCRAKRLTMTMVRATMDYLPPQ